VSQRTNAIGYEAVDLLEGRITVSHQGSGTAQSYTHTIIDVDLVLRESVATVAVGTEPKP
jgi:hypothetical protein